MTDRSVDSFSTRSTLTVADQQYTYFSLPEFAEAAGLFGRHVGIAYQIFDDLVDLYADESMIGKTLGTDIENRKLTLPLIHLMGKLKGDEKDSIITGLSSDDKSDRLMGMLEKHGSIEYSKEKIETYCNRAVDSIGVIVDSAAKEKLIEIAGFVAGRCY